MLFCLNEFIRKEKVIAVCIDIVYLSGFFFDISRRLVCERFGSVQEALLAATHSISRYQLTPISCTLQCASLAARYNMGFTTSAPRHRNSRGQMLTSYILSSLKEQQSSKIYLPPTFSSSAQQNKIWSIAGKHIIIFLPPEDMFFKLLFESPL